MAQNNKLKTGILIGLATLALLGGGWFFISQPDRKAVASVPTTTVSAGPIEQSVAATGKVEANFEVEIKAKASGKIIRLPYDVSDVVKTGDLLVQLDPIDEDRNVSQSQASLSGLESKASQSRVNLSVAERNLGTDLAKARADLQASQAKYADAQSKAKRLKELATGRFISEEEYETGRTTAAQATTDLQNAQTRLRELQTQQLSLRAQTEDVAYASAQAQAQRVALAASRQRLAETKIYAPINGVVTTRLGQIGQIVSSGISNVGGGTAILTLADLSHIYVLAAVDESDIGQVRQGQLARITADAFPGQRFTGKVIRIAPKGVEESNVVTFEVKIEIDGAGTHLLKPEMTTNVEIVIAHQDHALIVPSDAVITGRRDDTFVTVLNADGQQTRQPVTVGINNGTEAEIVSGLQAGDKLVTRQGQARSKWRKNGNGQGGPGANRQGQMMMMRGLGGRR